MYHCNRKILFTLVGIASIMSTGGAVSHMNMVHLPVPLILIRCDLVDSGPSIWYGETVRSSPPQLLLAHLTLDVASTLQKPSEREFCSSNSLKLMLFLLRGHCMYHGVNVSSSDFLMNSLV